MKKTIFYKIVCVCVCTKIIEIKCITYIFTIRIFLMYEKKDIKRK